MMKKTLFILTAFLLLFSINSQAQILYNKNCKATINGKITMEMVKAINNQVYCRIDLATSDLIVAMLIKSFEFEKALMQEHFNEDMESNTQPKASFYGKYTGFSADDLKKDGSYPVVVTGKLSLHGITKSITVNTVFDVKNGTLKTGPTIKFNLDDYNIPTRPGVTRVAILNLDVNFPKQ